MALHRLQIIKLSSQNIILKIVNLIYVVKNFLGKKDFQKYNC